MSINNDYYQHIINNYPEYVTKEQFYKIAHISKRTAQYLLQSKKVPCVESNKKTRKYKIKVLDIINYLIDRELRPLYYSPQHQKFQSDFSPSGFLRCKLRSLEENEIFELRNFFTYKMSEAKDVMNIKEISDFLGFTYELISRNCTKNKIQSFIINGKRLIPKVCLIEFLISSNSISLVGKSMKYDFLLMEFFRITK